MISSPESAGRPYASLNEKIERIRRSNLGSRWMAPHAPGSSPLSPVRIISPKCKGVDRSDDIGAGCNGGAVECREWKLISHQKLTPSPKTYPISPIKAVIPLGFSNINLNENSSEQSRDANSLSVAKDGALEKSLSSSASSDFSSSPSVKGLSANRSGTSFGSFRNLLPSSSPPIAPSASATESETRNLIKNTSKSASPLSLWAGSNEIKKRESYYYYYSQSLEAWICDDRFGEQLELEKNQYPLNGQDQVYFCTLMPHGDSALGSRVFPRTILSENWNQID